MSRKRKYELFKGETDEFELSYYNRKKAVAPSQVLTRTGHKLRS